MATLLQIQANRRNAQKSTGPRTVEGQAVSRLNALKTGIDARSQVIPGEDPDALEALTLEYHHRFQPAAPEQRFLVDAMVAADWQLRRLRKAEAQVWEYVMQDSRPEEDLVSSGLAFMRFEDSLTRLHRRIDAAERSYYRALQAIERLQNAASQSPQPDQAAPPEPDPITKPIILPVPDPQVQQNQSLHPQIGFVPPTSSHPPVHPRGVPGNRRGILEYRA
jgi:hypothetical protein